MSSKEDNEIKEILENATTENKSIFRTSTPVPLAIKYGFITIEKEVNDKIDSFGNKIKKITI